MIVLDASVLLDLLWNRQRGTAVRNHLVGQQTRVVNAVQVAEVASLVASRGGNWARAERVLASFRIRAEPFVPADGVAAANEPASLSLGDRSCLAFGHNRKASILTADRGWTGLTGVTVL